MTNEEIVRDYNQAANKSKQIKILADLNETSPSEIKTVLAQAGVVGVKMPKIIRPRRKPEPAAKEEPPAAPPEPSARTPAVYGQIEAILAILPAAAPQSVRRSAADLLWRMFGEYLEDRLGLAEGGARDEAD